MTATRNVQDNPNAHLTMSEMGKHQIQQEERMVLNYYNDPVGNCTYGPGILAHGKTPCTPAELGQPVGQAQINLVFAQKIAEAERVVRRNVNKQPLTQEQFDALVSLTYNAGSSGANDTFHLVNSGDFEGAADNMCKIIYARNSRTGVLERQQGLIARRARESAPFRVQVKKR